MAREHRCLPTPPSLMRLLSRVLASVALFVTVVTGALAADVEPASAHNTFQGSDPEDGSTLDAAPEQIAMVFTQPVPLDSATVQVIDASGTRTEVSGLTHSPEGENVLVAPLPPMASGEVTVRWRLVGPDGHPLTDRIVFTVAAPVAAYPVPTTVASAVAVPVEPPPTTTSAPVAETAVDELGFSTPGPLRWLLRYGSYLAIMVVVGIVLTDRLVWPGVADRPSFRSLVVRALLGIGVLAAVQLLVLASDISGEAPWSSLGSLDIATRTNAGLAFVIRILIVGFVWCVLYRMKTFDEEVRWTAVGLAGVALLGTWAWAGHSVSQRWPELGVPLDVVHHVAAAVWIGALIIVGWCATRRLNRDDLAPVVGRLSRVAAVSVGLIVVTGLAQTLRLVGTPTRLFAADHGTYLVIKLALLAGMLVFANANRRRVATVVRRPDRLNSGTVTQLRRTILIEFGVGLAIIGITAAMVVSPPATSTSTAPPVRVAESKASYYTP